MTLFQRRKRDLQRLGIKFGHGWNHLEYVSLFFADTLCVSLLLFVVCCCLDGNVFLVGLDSSLGYCGKVF